MGKLQFHENKTLKLNNVLKYKILLKKEEQDLNVIIQQMQSYIKAKGSIQIGPLIQCTRTIPQENDKLEVEIIFMLQCNNYICQIEPPYSMESIIRIPNSLYCRYNGPEMSLKFAYDKIYLEAFENDVKLTNSTYTVFLNNNYEENYIIADVFIPRKENI